MSFDYKKYFPHKTIRKEQARAIEFALDQFINKDKKIVIIEAGTGVGKSAIGKTIASYLNKIESRNKEDYEEGSWFLTTQKILQDQYVKDFGPPKGEMCSVKSAHNYKCNFFKSNKCSDSLQLLKEADNDSPFFKSCAFGCVYKQAKKFFLESPLSITNFPYFLTETGYVQGITPRRVLVVDECHTIEDELSRFVEVSVSERFASAILKVDMIDTNDQTKAFEWVKKEYSSALEEEILELEKELETVKDSDNTDEIRRVTTNIDRMKKHKTKIDKFINLYSKENWVFNHVPSFNQSGRKFEFKSIDIGSYAWDLLFQYGEKILLMSATVLNKEAYCESIGLKPEDVAMVSIDSPFPVENTPVLYYPIGDMSVRKIEETLPNMVEAIKSILDEHKGEKGIIHARTFKIANYIKDNIKNKRLITHDSMNRDEIVKKHMESKSPTVLISPSSTEGLDLKDDLSRFQIICKMHWPYLGDGLVKKRMQKYEYWYAYQAVKSLIQARGRSVRSKDDYAVTYILDKGFENLYYKNYNMFPKYFRKSLHME